MNIFGWLLLILTVSLLVGLCFLLIVMALQFYAARKRVRKSEIHEAAINSSLLSMESNTDVVPLLPAESGTPELPIARTVIGQSVVIKGQIFSGEDLYMDGAVEGIVEVPENKLTIGLNGKVQASIKAREVIVLGCVRGDLEASDRLEVGREARIVGDIKTVRIIIEDGAYIKGSIDILKVKASLEFLP